MSGSEIVDQIYLGDGAYATFDGRGIWLTTRNHDVKKAKDKIYLEPYVWTRLKEWVETRGYENK